MSNDIVVVTSGPSGFPRVPPQDPSERIIFWTYVGVESCAIISYIFSQIIGFMSNPHPVFSVLGKGLFVLSLTCYTIIAATVIGLIAYSVMKCFQRFFPFSNVSPAVENPRQAVVQTFSSHYQEMYRANRERESRLPFRERETTPGECEDDEILCQYICPLTRTPIRHPVIDPTSGTMYERSAIETWIEEHHDSPASGRPLERDNLVLAGDAQSVIDNRLRELQEERDAMEREISEYLEHRQQELGQIPVTDSVVGETVPEEFEDDEILGQYKCPITQVAIRHPVIDPTSRMMYERAALEYWIDLQHTSPLTRRPLERADLLPAPAVQEIIDNRLRELQDHHGSQVASQDIPPTPDLIGSSSSSSGESSPGAVSSDSGQRLER